MAGIPSPLPNMALDIDSADRDRAAIKSLPKEKSHHEFGRFHRTPGREEGFKSNLNAAKRSSLN
jgi:hypothetical protein